MGDDRDMIDAFIGRTPAAPIEACRRARIGRGLGQARGHEPGRFHQGSAGTRDDSGRRAQRSPLPWPDDRRADVRQYRNRPRPGSCSERISAGTLPSVFHERGAQAHPYGVRRRARPHRSRASHDRRHRGGEANRGGDRCLLAEPVRQPRESSDALRDDQPRAVGCDGGSASTPSCTGAERAGRSPAWAGT